MRVKSLSLRLPRLEKRLHGPRPLRFANEVQRDAWAVILAGGDGTRLQKLTSKIAGDSRPKQFCRIFGNKSLLGHTRERLRPVFREVDREIDSLFDNSANLGLLISVVAQVW
jgi:hypothetical protein